MPTIAVADVLNKNASQRDLSDVLTMVNAADTPLLSMIAKGPKVNNVLGEWPIDRQMLPKDFTDVDTEPLTKFEGTMDNYDLIRAYMQYGRVGAKVGKIAQVVQNLAGVSDKIGYSRKQIFMAFKYYMEAFLGGDQETAPATGTDGYRGRGMGKWLQNTAQSILPVPAQYRTPAAQVDTTAMASVTPATINAVMQSAAENAGGKQDWVLVCGSKLKGCFKNFTAVTTGATNTMATVRTYTQPLESKKIVDTVDIYEGDNGTLTLMVSYWLGYDLATPQTALTDTNRCRGYMLIPDKFEMRMIQGVQLTELADADASGKGFYYDAMFQLRCTNPLVHGQFRATS